MIAKMHRLLAARKDSLRLVSWGLGDLARDVLATSGGADGFTLKTRALAVSIGLVKKTVGRRTDDSTFRQVIKFATVAKRSQAVDLQKRELPWRGIVYWLGVNDEAPKAFQWTAKADAILEKVRRARAVLDKMQTA